MEECKRGEKEQKTESDLLAKATRHSNQWDELCDNVICATFLYRWPGGTLTLLVQSLSLNLSFTLTCSHSSRLHNLLFILLSLSFVLALLLSILSSEEDWSLRSKICVFHAYFLLFTSSNKLSTGWLPQTGKNYETVDASFNGLLVSGRLQVMENSLTFTLSASWFL